MGKLKIFIVSTELPSTISGTPVRSFNLIKQLSANTYSASLFTIINESTKKILPTVEKELNIPIYATSLSNFNVIRKIYVYLSKRVIPYMEEFKRSGIVGILIDKINKEHPEIIQLETINAYYLIKDIIPFIKEKNIKIVFNAHNVEQKAFKEDVKTFGFIKKMLAKWTVPNFIKLENEAAKNADHIFTCSEEDKTFFANFVPVKKITVIPNGVDVNFFRPKKLPTDNVLFFMGKAGYPPNNEALRYYFSKIHPLVKKELPNIKVCILCGNPPQWIREIIRKDNSVTSPGFVDDVREYLDKAKICISPIKSGSGTSLKILEYMSMEKPIVSSSIGVRGIEVDDYKNILIADNPNVFANKIIWLIKNPTKADKIGKNARELVMKKYDWELIGKTANNVYQNNTGKLS